MTKTIIKKTAICLKTTGTASEFLMDSIENINKELSISKIPKSYKRSTGNGKLIKVHDFEFNDKMAGIYAWNDGEAGWENKNELPPPIAEDLYFGNIYIIGHNDNKQVDISMDEYKSLLNKYFGGFEDLGSDDSWSSEEEVDDDDSIHDFIVNDDEEEYESESESESESDDE
tara:strand:+ start:6635 stop:7150 length:516 start_codon:yes stop_codon:yes gene_type:complete